MRAAARLARRQARDRIESRIQLLDAAVAPDAPVTTVPLEYVLPSPFTPTPLHTQPQLRRLLDSLRAGAPLPPVPVWRLRQDTNRWTVLEGELRRRAAQKLGHRLLSVQVAVVPDEPTAELLTLVLNLRRRTLSPLHEAAACDRLLSLGLSREHVAVAIGLSRGLVSYSLQLLDFPEELQRAIDLGALSPHHARYLHRFLPWPRTLRRLARRVIAEGWSCARLSKELPQHYGLAPGVPEPEDPHPDPDPRSLEGVWRDSHTARAERLAASRLAAPGALTSLSPESSARLATSLAVLAGRTATLAAVQDLLPARAAEAAALPPTPISLHPAWHAFFYDLAQDNPSLPLEIAAEAYRRRPS